MAQSICQYIYNTFFDYEHTKPPYVVLKKGEIKKYKIKKMSFLCYFVMDKTKQFIFTPNKPSNADGVVYGAVVFTYMIVILEP